MLRPQDVNPARRRAEFLIGQHARLVLKPGDGFVLVGPTLDGVVRVVDDYGVDMGPPLPAVPWEWISDVRGRFGAIDPA